MYHGVVKASEHAWRDVFLLAKTRVKKQFPALLIAGGLFVVAVGLIGLIFGLNLLSTQQDLRQQAAVPGGTVEVTFSAPTTAAVNQSMPLRVLLNTKGMQVDGVQLAIVLPKSLDDPFARVSSSLPIQIVYQQLDTSANTTNTLKLIVINQQIGQPFSTTQAEQILTIDTYPNQNGTFSISADNNVSLVTRHASDPPEDVLKPITPISVTVGGGAGPTNTPTPSIAAGPTPPCTTFLRPEQTRVSCIPNEGLSIDWTDMNPNDAHPAEEAGFKIYRIDNDPVYNQTGTPGSAPVATLPTHDGSGAMNYTYADPEVRFGYTPGQFYRFLIYTWKAPASGMPVSCHKQSAIGVTCPLIATATATPTPTPDATRPTATPTPPNSCNNLCRSDLECADGLFCYFGPGGIMDSGRCRLQENPESTTCQLPEPQVAVLSLATRLQGLSKPNVPIKATITLDPLYQLDSATNIVPVTYIFDVELTTNADGVLQLNNTLPLENVPTNQKYLVFVKTEWSLRRKLGEMVIQSGMNVTPEEWQKQILLVGDFVNLPPEQANRINVLDLAAMLNVYTQLSTPVTPLNAKFDVNYDGVINILDLSVVLSNYTQLEVVGD